MMSTESELISRCQQGDRLAMGQLYTAMHDELLAVCRRHVADSSAAEDVLHDAFMLIFSRIATLRSPKSARPWMHKVVRNVARLYNERRHKLKTVPIDHIADDTAATAAAAAITYDELMNHVNALPEGYRRVFRLSVLEGLSHQEIAQLLNIEPHSSSSQLYRAKHLLRQSLTVLLLSLLAVLLPVGVYKMMTKDDKLADGEVASAGKTESGGKTEHTKNSESGMEPEPETQPKAEGESHTPLTTPRKSQTRNGTTVLEEEPKVAENKIAEPQKADETTEKEVTVEPAQSNDRKEIAAVSSGEAIESTTEKHSNEVSLWHVDLAFSSLPSGHGEQLPMGIEGTNASPDIATHHRLPLTLGLRVGYTLSKKWRLDGGLSYTLLTSDMKEGDRKIYIDRHQQVRYLGFSLGATRQLWTSAHRRSGWSVYSSASAGYDVPLRSTLTTTYVAGSHNDGEGQTTLHPAAQWSLGVGAGLQYSLTPAVGFFAEPGLRYYFHNGDEVETWRTEHPLSFSLPLGIRVTF